MLASMMSFAMSGKTASAGELDARMAKIVKTFSHAAAEAGVSTATLAVLPFQTDKKLAEKRVDYACAEILTNRFIEAKTFKVTERARLEEVMKEQRLGLSGALESETAARVGKILGARLVILGSVSRLANAYHLSTEMVDSGTGEILASDVTEVAVEVFDKDASQYVVLVPDIQAIGIYLSLGHAAVTSKKVPASTGAGYTFTPGNGTAQFTVVSVGARYFFSPKWMADASFGVASKFDSGSKPFFTISDGVNSDKQDGSILDGNSVIRLSFNRSSVLTEKFRLYTGAGFMWLTVGSKTDPSPVSIGTGETAHAKTLEGASFTLPFARLGFEWRPQTRLGISAFGTYNLVKKDYKGYSNADNIGDNVLTQQFTLPQFIVDITMALYF